MGGSAARDVVGRALVRTREVIGGVPGTIDVLRSALRQMRHGLETLTERRRMGVQIQKLAGASGDIQELVYWLMDVSSR